MSNQPLKIDIGCGMQKKHGFVGIDRIEMPGVEIICDLDKQKIPLDDNSVSEVYSMHFLEHTANILFVMEEIWRVCETGAKISISVPYFDSVGAFRDPTHKGFFSYETFDYFTDTDKFPSFYSKAKFKIVNKKLLFYSANSNFYGRIRFIHMMPFQFLANLFPYFYEHSFLRLFRAHDLSVELEAVKD